MDIDTMLLVYAEVGFRYGFLGAILGGVASALVGGLLGGSSAKATNASNQAIATQETEFNQASAREANALTEKLAGEANTLTDRLSARAIKSTEGMTSSAIALSKSQFDQSQAFNERMSNTAYTRGVADLKRAGLNPILAATRGVTSTPSVSGGPTASGSGTGGSGTAGHGSSAQASRFRKVDAGLQALNSAAAVGRVTQEIEAMYLANQARRKFGKGPAADVAETTSKVGKTIGKQFKLKPGRGKKAAKIVNIYTRKIQRAYRGEKSALRKAAARNQAARGPHSNYMLFGPGRKR